jgi:CRISPR/Cas system-associated exonuclease Cas4 (RecB family)
MPNRFGEHDGDTSDIDSGYSWAYDGELDLDIEDEYKPGPVSDGMAHISKSRIKTFLKCPRSFGFKYLAEERDDELPERFTPLMSDSEDWFQFVEYIGPFFEWELERWEAAKEAADTLDEARQLWVPHSIETSLKIDDPTVGELPWLGPYDVLYHAASVPEVDADEGYVVVDYKTGTVSDEQYRGTGIHIDLEFYAWILEQAGYDVAAGIGFYPGDDSGKVVREMPNEETRERIRDVITHFHEADAAASEFEPKPSGLCGYCHYQDQCPGSHT